MSNTTVKIMKRKRSRNTTSQQIELYLEAMEGDYAFRSNTINPSLPPNYINEKWEELATKLNSLGDGPVMSTEEWKKRFTDWKYNLKSKHRKLISHRNRTGGGPNINTALSPLEERALNVWGRVTVEGVTTVTKYEGIPGPSQDIVAVEEASTVTRGPSPLQENLTDVHSEPLHSKENAAKKSPTVPKQKKHKPNPRTKPISALAENLIEISKTSTQTKLVEVFENFTVNYLKLKIEQLDFEIKKFQYLHPDFRL